jgi:hypothetical protein
MAPGQNPVARYRPPWLAGPGALGCDGYQGVTATPAIYKVPMSDGIGKIADGWLKSTIARLTGFSSVVDLESESTCGSAARCK